MSPTSLALSNLRAFVILIVVGFHSVLAYLDSRPLKQSRFDAPPYDWQSFPIIDSQRFFGFDLFCAWHDVYLMSLMFFISGLFVWPSLKRKGSGTFLRDRLLRLGLPLVLAVYVLMPIALYPSYRISAADPSIAEYWRQFLALPFWPCGPQWFLWQLLGLNLVAAGLHKITPRAGGAFATFATWAATHPGRFLLALLAASAVAYVPLALIYSPWTWFHFGPFHVQECRWLHYAVYFFAGLALGAHGLDRGLLAADGLVARRWPLALGGAVAGFLLWILPTALIMDYKDAPAPLLLQFVANLGFVACCAGGCAFVLALALRFARMRSRILDSLSVNAYGIYLVHYVFVVWMQYALLGVALPAAVKATLVFAVTVLLSWGITVAIGRILFEACLVRIRRLAGAPKPSGQA